jgi:hypothetical protein
LTYRALYTTKDGNPWTPLVSTPRAFECLLCPHDLNEKTRCWSAGIGRRQGRYVTTTRRGMTAHQFRVHGFKPQPELPLPKSSDESALDPPPRKLRISPVSETQKENQP